MRKSYALIILFLFVVSAPAFALTEWEKKALADLAKTPNKMSVQEWNKLADWEKPVLYKTRTVRRVDPKIALHAYQTRKTMLISVDAESYYKSRRIVGAINIPSAKFTDSFIKKNLNKFKNKIIILYCR